MAIQYRLRIVRGDQEFEAEGDRAFVLKMADRFSSGAGLVPALEETPSKSKKGASEGGTRVVVEKTGKQISVREFVQKLGLKKHTDIVLAFAYFLEHNLGKPSFTPADINNLYYEAKLEPSNTSQACILNIRRSFMMEDKKAGGEKGGRKAYTLTQTGEAFVQNKLEKPAE